MLRLSALTAFPKTDYQRCMVHMVRGTLKYVASKDMKSFASELKTMYNAVSEGEGLKAHERVVEKWSAKYPSYSYSEKAAALQEEAAFESSISGLGMADQNGIRY